MEDCDNFYKSQRSGSCEAGRELGAKWSKHQVLGLALCRANGLAGLMCTAASAPSWHVVGTSALYA
ncbi:hypothetical protein IF2G_07275 [Cordyceps javanica]|nr:hypothetical protein IF2G_07275 [Cordyceps javanica]